MKILWDSGNFGFGTGGIQEWDRSVIETLRSKGHEVTIVVDDLLVRRPKFKKWKPPAGGFTRVDGKITVYNYKEIVDKLGPFDVQVGNHFTMFPVCDNILPICHDVEIKGRDSHSRGSILALRSLLRKTNKVACTSPFIEDQVKAMAPGMGTVCCWAGTKFRTPSNPNPSAKPYIAYWGNRYEKSKNFDALLKSLSFHNLDLRVSGFLPPTESELGLVKALGFQDRVHFYTALSDQELEALVTGATMYVCPSKYEGMGMPAMEALATGLPTVVSPYAALPVLFKDCSYISKNAGARSLAAAINECLTNREQTALNVKVGLQRSEEWTWDLTTNRLLSLMY